MSVFQPERKYAVHIGEVIVNECIKNDFPINTSKLMKLLYFMQILHIQKYGKLMFENEIIATKCGPYIPDVNNFFIAGRVGFNQLLTPSIVLLDSHRDVVTTVLEQYGTLSPNELMEISKNEPFFKKIWQNGNGEGILISGNVILSLHREKPDMQEYLENLKKLVKEYPEEAKKIAMEVLIETGVLDEKGNFKEQIVTEARHSNSKKVKVKIKK